MIMVTMPTQWENIKFFFSYQLNWMYWRYFMMDITLAGKRPWTGDAGKSTRE